MSEPSNSSPLPTSGELQSFLEYLRLERHYSEHTIAAYGGDLRSLLDFVVERGLCESLTAVGKPEIRSWLRELSESVGSSTLARKMATVRAFFAFAIESGVASQNPARGMRLPKVRRKDPVLVSAEAAEELMTVTMDDDSPQGCRDRAVLELLYGCGLRVSELTSLDIESVDRESSRLRVLGKGKKARRVPLGAPALRALDAHMKHREQQRTKDESERALFLGARGARLGVRRVQELVKTCGAVATGRNGLHPHALRHACATHMLEGGADLRAIQDLLGHETVATTQRYTHLTTHQLTTVYDAAHPLSQPKERQDVDDSGKD